MGIFQELAKRAALKTVSAVKPEITTAAERNVGTLVPVKPSGLEQAARAVQEGKIARPITNDVAQAVESPSRRSFLKKTAASAARASVPDSIAEPVMAYVAKEIMKSPVKSIVSKEAPIPSNSMWNYILENGSVPESFPEHLRDFYFPDKTLWKAMDMNELFNGSAKYVNPYNIYDILEEVVPGFVEKELSKVPYDVDWEDLDKLFRNTDWSKYGVE